MISASAADGAVAADRSLSLVEGFARYLGEVRGLSALTVEAYVSDVRRFLDRREGSGLRGLTAIDVSAAVLAELGRRSPATVRRYGVSLRSFCGTAICPA
jgi:site-specific recombinase XerD